MILSPNDEEVANSSKKTYPIQDWTNHTLFTTKVVEIDTLFQTKIGKKKHTLWRGTYLYCLYKGIHPPPPPTHPKGKRVADYESRCLRKRD